MLKKYGRDLFLPEGDDYSKTEFDQHQEEMSMQGQAVLQRLRMEQVAAQQNYKTVQKGVKSNDGAATTTVRGKDNQKAGANSEEKLSYKEMLEKAVARK